MFLLGTNIKYGTHGKVDIFTLWLMTVLKEHYYFYYSSFSRFTGFLNKAKSTGGQNRSSVSLADPAELNMRSTDNAT